MSLFNVGFVIFPHLTSGGRGQRQRLGPDRGYRGQFSKGEILPHSNTANTREKLMETLVANRPRLTRWILCRSDGLAPRAGQNRARAVCFDPDYREATRVSATFPVAVLLLSKHGQRSHNRSSLNEDCTLYQEAIGAAVGAPLGFVRVPFAKPLGASAGSSTLPPCQFSNVRVLMLIPMYLTFALCIGLTIVEIPSVAELTQ